MRLSSLLLPAGSMPLLASRSWRSPLQLATGGWLGAHSHPPPSDTRATLASHWCTPTRNCATHQLARMDNLRTEKCATHPRMDNLRNCETVPPTKDGQPENSSPCILHPALQMCLESSFTFRATNDSLFFDLISRILACCLLIDSLQWRINPWNL